MTYYGNDRLAVVASGDYLDDKRGAARIHGTAP